MSTAFASLLILIVLTLVFLIISLAKLIYYGKKITFADSKETEGELISLHVKCVNDFLLSLATAIILVELFVIERGGRLGDPLLFKIHFILDSIVIVVLVVMRLSVTGKKDKVTHRKLAKCFYVLFALVFVTGGVLMIQVLMKY